MKNLDTIILHTMTMTYECEPYQAQGIRMYAPTEFQAEGICILISTITNILTVER